MSEGRDFFEYDQTKEAIIKLVSLYMRGEKFMFNGTSMVPQKIEQFRIFQTSHWRSYMEIGHRTVWDSGRDVTRDFINFKSSGPIEPKETSKKNVFIVHGRDYSPMKELKTMLEDFGLNSIVLHEQPSGSRTIVEKLEKYSDVGYAFVILTPEDVITELPFPPPLPPFPPLKFKYRARQNVVLEFGYFMGLLSRDRVCCLYKGNVELPSDMHGIVYIPFKESVNEVRDKIIKELKEAGYDI